MITMRERDLCPEKMLSPRGRHILLGLFRVYQSAALNVGILCKQKMAFCEHTRRKYQFGKSKLCFMTPEHVTHLKILVPNEGLHKIHP